MKIVKLNQLVNTNFNPTFINSLKQFWYTTKKFQCINSPKKQNLFLLLVGCKARFDENNGKTTLCESGDLVYVPKGSEYKLELFDFESDESHTIGINFLLFDENQEEIILSSCVEVLGNSSKCKIENLFIESLKTGVDGSLIEFRIILMQLFSALTVYEKTKTFPYYIIDSINYLNENLENVPTVSELAKRAVVSEVYFRKQFKTYLGKSPLEYRNELRLLRAKSYLEHGEISIQEISDTLGYATVSHFIKEFKTRYGYSPLKFRNLTKKAR